MIRAYLKANYPYEGVTLNVTPGILYYDKGLTLDSGDFDTDFSILFLLAELFAGSEIYLAPSLDRYLAIS